jgi:hypothetical protein
VTLQDVEALRIEALAWIGWRFIDPSYTTVAQYIQWDQPLLRSCIVVYNRLEKTHVLNKVKLLVASLSENRAGRFLAIMHFTFTLESCEACDK